MKQSAASRAVAQLLASCAGDPVKAAARVSNHGPDRMKD